MCAELTPFPRGLQQRLYHLARPQFISLACLGVIRPGGREAGFRTDGEQEREEKEEDKSPEECLSNLTSHKNPWYALAYNQIIIVALGSLIIDNRDS